MGISFSLYYNYILGVSVLAMQHDVGVFSNINEQVSKMGGHAPYIEYIQKNYKLPETDVSKTWQFIQPPLHHIICAIWLEINEKVFKLNKRCAQENLQILTLFYVICIIISSYKILRYFKLTGISFICPLTIICFFPAFIILSGSINNDALSVAFITGALLNTIYWIKEQNIKNIINIALCVGFGMMTKLSTVMLVPPLFILFVYSYIKSLNKNTMLKQFLIFLIISIPLGTWFNIKNYIKHNIPITFVGDMGTISMFKPQYVGNINYWDRITDFSFNQFQPIYVHNKQIGDIRNDYNPLITLMKSALFGEYIRSNIYNKYPLINTISVIFFWIFVIISSISLFSMFYITLQSLKETQLLAEIIFLLVFFITMILSLYKHAYNIPYVASMNFRFIIPTAIIGPLFLGLLNQNFNYLQSKYRNIILTILTLTFASCSIIIFIMFNVGINSYNI